MKTSEMSIAKLKATLKEYENARCRAVSRLDYNAVNRCDKNIQEVQAEIDKRQ